MRATAALLLALSQCFGSIENSGINRRDFRPELPTDPTMKAPLFNGRYPFGYVRVKKAPAGFSTGASAGASRDDDEPPAKSPKPAGSSPPVVQRCEAVLVNEKVILTSSECKIGPGYTGTFYVSGANKKIAVNAGSVKETSFKHKLMSLSEKFDVPIPVFSWVADQESLKYDWLVRPQPDDEINYHLSSAFANYDGGGTKQEVKNVLKTCTQVDRDPFIGLRCTNIKICDGDKVKTGATIFTVQKAFDDVGYVISLHGMVTLAESGTFCKGTNEKISPGASVPTSPDCSKAYVCARQFTRSMVEEILSVARSLDGSKFLSTDVFPGDTIIATFNLQGLAKFEGSAGTMSSRAVRKLILDADILLLQEAKRLSDSKLVRDRLLNGIFSIDSLQPSVKYSLASTGRENVFLYKADKFIKNSCESVALRAESTGTVDMCVFQSTEANTVKFSIYNVHMPPGRRDADWTLRESALKRITKHAKNKGIRHVIIGGDFNVAGGADTSSAISELEFTAKYLEQFHFPDPGSTTVRKNRRTASTNAEESHYDRFAVSRSLRLMHAHYPKHGEKVKPDGAQVITTQNDRLDYYINKYVPRHIKRDWEPTVRSYQLSDHLIVSFPATSGSSKKICTWNMENFDPTAGASSTAKSRLYSAYYEQTLSQCEVVAVQELRIAMENLPATTSMKETLPPGSGTSGATINVYKARAAGKNWVWSTITKELGFAYSDTTTLESCIEIDNIIIKSRAARNAFSCTFRISGKRVTVASVHVLNRYSTQEVAKGYLTRIKEKLGLRSAVDTINVYIVGDFNVDFANDRATRCIHSGASFLTFTKLDKFTITDLVWKFPSTLTSLSTAQPGITGCKVLNPETLRQDENDNTSPFIIPDKIVGGKKIELKMFSTWQAISDHYPVFMKFYVPV